MQSNRGGKIDLINTSAFFLIFLYNLIDQIAKGQNLFDRIEYTLPFLVVGVLSLFIKTNLSRAIIYLFIGVTVTVTAESISDFSGSIFFIFAYNQVKKYEIQVLIFALLCVTIRSIIIKDTIPGTALMCIVYLFVFGIYWLTIKIHKKPFPELKKQENQLLYLLSNGFTQKEAAAEIGTTQSQVSEMVKRIRKKTGANTLYEILYSYGSINRI